jgi:hypothetical protein
MASCESCFLRLGRVIVRAITQFYPINLTTVIVFLLIDKKVDVGKIGNGTVSSVIYKGEVFPLYVLFCCIDTPGVFRHGAEA